MCRVQRLLNRLGHVQLLFGPPATFLFDRIFYCILNQPLVLPGILRRLPSHSADTCQHIEVTFAERLVAIIRINTDCSENFGMRAR